MSSYQPLADHLAAQRGSVWDASFADIERTLGRSLPRSAYRHNAWWANQTGPGHSQTHGWRSVGWKTAKLDLERQRVRFEREFADSSSGEVSGGIDERLLREAMRVSGIADYSTVINAALRELIEQTAIQAVIDLGGSAPGFQAAPRERPWA